MGWSYRGSFWRTPPQVPRLLTLSCQAGIEDQRGTEAQKTPCGATPTYRQERPMISIPLEEPGTQRRDATRRHVQGRKHCQCQAEFLDSPMAASFIRSVNVGQNVSDTKERLSRISFRYEGRSLQSNSVGSSAGGEGRYAQPYPSDDGEQSADLHIQKTDVTLQGGRCPADQPSRSTSRRVALATNGTQECDCSRPSPCLYARSVLQGSDTHLYFPLFQRSLYFIINFRLPAMGAFIKRSD